MLKYILSFIIAMLSINTYADDYRCEVPNTGGTKVELVQTNGQTDNRGDYKIQVKFTDVKQSNVISVTINVFDALTDDKVDVKTIKENVTRSGDLGSVWVTGLKPFHSYYFKLHTSSCTQ